MTKKGTNAKKKFDKNGLLASRGKINEIILEQAQELYSNRPNQETLTLDVNDFDVSFARGLSLEDGAATLTALTCETIIESVKFLPKQPKRWLITGGGRHNQYLMGKLNRARK